MIQYCLFQTYKDDFSQKPMFLEKKCMVISVNEKKKKVLDKNRTAFYGQHLLYIEIVNYLLNMIENVNSKKECKFKNKEIIYQLEKQSHFP